jgi:transcription antitermination factor NusG
VPDSVIKAIRIFRSPTHLAHANGCLYPHAKATDRRVLVAGTRVRVTEGAFSDLVGDLSEMSDGERVKVLLQVLGAQRPVEMNQTAVEVVE